MLVFQVDAGEGLVLGQSWRQRLWMPAASWSNPARVLCVGERLPSRAVVWTHVQAMLPFFTYLLLFQNNELVRWCFGLDRLTPPNAGILPVVEYSVFHGLPHRIMARFAHPVLDILAAVPYLVHFVLPFAYTVYLLAHRSRRHRFHTFWWLFGWTNLIAVLFQTVFPTAPPWYTDTMAVHPDGTVTTGMKEAGFERVDAMVGVPVFHNIYMSSPLQFGAFPSLHCAWPMTLFMSGPWLGRAAGIGHVVWIALAAVYSNHHYAIDCIAGAALVVMLHGLFQHALSPFVSHERRAALAASSSLSRRSSCVEQAALVGDGRDEEAAIAG